VPKTNLDEQIRGVAKKQTATDPEEIERKFINLMEDLG